VTFPAKALLAIALLSVVLFGTAARPAAAATPCWKTLLNDWYDGRIDQTYPSHCYTQAIAHLPTDVQTYSSAREDILRALQSAKAKARKAGHPVSQNTLIVPAPTTTTTTTSTTTASSPGPAATDANRRKGLAHVADQLNSGGASSLPVPLLVLGALAILLVAAGGAGLVVKRVQSRRPGP
jgi:hypothetical protein